MLSDRYKDEPDSRSAEEKLEKLTAYLRALYAQGDALRKRHQTGTCFFSYWLGRADVADVALVMLGRNMSIEEAIRMTGQRNWWPPELSHGE